MNLSVQDAAKMLRVSEREIYRWIREGTIPVHRVSDHYRFHKSELLEWATTHGVRVSSEEFHGVEAESLPGLVEALERGGVHDHVPGDDRDSVLRAVVDRMPIDEDERDLLYDFLVARESLGSTGVGEGIAIPHVRNPVVFAHGEPSVTLCFLERPVDFRSIDGQPVHTVFTLVCRTVRSHLYLLSRLSAALHDPGFRSAVVRRAPASEILDEARRVERRISRHPPPAKEPRSP